MNGNWSDIAFITLPLLYAVSAAIAPAMRTRSGWLNVQISAAAALLLSLALPLLKAPLSGLFSAAGMNATVTVLVAFIGLVVARFSARYLDGDPGQPTFQRWFLLTLGCVVTVVTTNHLGVLIGAWVGISLGLHQLLMFYPQRKRAALAAHKKFLFARAAELCLLVAAAVLYIEHSTLFIEQIFADVSAAGSSLSTADQVAAVFLASAAMIKCAQFPMHGWLIQVVEAPTPVSALLHAGVINLGGFLLLAMAPLMQHALIANWLLLVVAGITCVAAALITMTRVSIKVLLAWSTVAQMGLMLVECALGQYGLALLHLVAHSCYKAYAFLASGSEVEIYLQDQMAPARKCGPATLPVFFLTAVAALVVFTAQEWMGTDASLWPLAALFPIVLLGESGAGLSRSAMLRTLGLTGILIVAYWTQKSLFAAVAPLGTDPGLAATVWCATLVTVLIGAYWLLRHRGKSPLAQKLYRHLYAGFYLDEWATRATLAIWPANLPHRAGPRKATSYINQETLS